MEEREAFAGGDQNYLRTEQYGDGTKLGVRVALHQNYSTATTSFPDFIASHIDWSTIDTILECGSGTGRFWDNTGTRRSTSLTLTDLSPGMVDEAVTNATANGFDDVVGHECDVQNLPFDSDSFDAVIANHMLYHVPDPDLAVAELARVLRPGGVMIAGTNAYGHMAEMNETVAAVFDSHAEKLYEVFGMDTGERRLRRQFASITWHAYDNDLVVTEPGAAVAYGLSYPPGEHATPEQAEAFEAAIGDRFADGHMRIRTRAGVFICRDQRG